MLKCAPVGVPMYHAGIMLLLDYECIYSPDFKFNTISQCRLGEASKKNQHLIFGLLAQTRGGGVSGGPKGPIWLTGFFQKFIK